MHFLGSLDRKSPFNISAFVLNIRICFLQIRIFGLNICIVRVADRLIIFPYQLAHFHRFTLADYCT